MRTETTKGRGTRARVIGLFAFIMLLVGTAAGQKGSFPEITQLHGPQKPRVGFMVQVSAKGTLTPEQDAKLRAALKLTIDRVYAILHRQASSGAAIRTASKQLRSSQKLINAFGLAALDSKGKLAASSSGDVGNFSGQMCAGISIGAVNAATEVCSDVQQHAVTVEVAMNAYFKKAKGRLPSLTILDTFGNMAMSEREPGIYVGYAAADGKAVVR